MKVNKSMKCSNTDCVYLSIHKICLYSDDVEGYVDCLSRDMIPAKNDFKDCNCDCFRELNDLKDDLRFIVNRAKKDQSKARIHPFASYEAMGKVVDLLILDINDLTK